MNTEVAVRQRPLTIQYEVSDIERMARAISASKLFGISTPEQALALCLIAQAEGRHPASAAQDYHIIQGKPSKKADAMLRDFIGAGGKIEWHKLDDTIADATFSHPNGGTARISWDMARAKTAQLTTAMWNKYPRQMLRSRVVSEGVRTIYPMATSGMYVPEEVQEFEPDTKSSFRARKDGDWDGIQAEITACTSIAELEAWREKNAERLATFPAKWTLTMNEEVFEPHRASLMPKVALVRTKDAAPSKSVEGPTSTQGSAEIRAKLISALYSANSTDELSSWRKAYAADFKTMSSDDQRTVSDELAARRAELFEVEKERESDAGTALDNSNDRGGLNSIMGG